MTLDGPAAYPGAVEILLAIGAVALFAVLWFTRRAREISIRQRFRTEFAETIAAIEPGKSPVGPAREVLHLFADAPSCIAQMIRPLRPELEALHSALQKSTTWGTEFIDLDQQHQAVRDALLALVRKWTSLEHTRPVDPPAMSQGRPIRTAPPLDSHL